MLSIWEIKIVRKMHGVKKEGNEWKIRSNQKMRNMCEQPGIIAEIKRLKWLIVHVGRMEQNRVVEKYLKDTLVEEERRVCPGCDGWTILKRILD
jgi:hypothetical protein